MALALTTVTQYAYGIPTIATIPTKRKWGLNIETGDVTWTPESQDECIFAWYSESGITKNGSNRVSSWVDQKNGYDLVQVTDSKKLVWTANQLNTYPALISDGIDDWMQTVNFAGGVIAQPITICAIAQGVLDVAETAVLVDGNDITNRCALYYPDTDTYGIFAGTEVKSGTAVEGSNYHSQIGVFNGASSDLWLDGTKIIDGQNAGSTGLDGLTIGAAYLTSAAFWEGGIVAIVGFNIASADLITNLRNWSLTKYGI